TPSGTLCRRPAAPPWAAAPCSDCSASRSSFSPPTGCNSSSYPCSWSPPWWRRWRCSKSDTGSVDNLQMLIATSAALFALGLLGVIIRRNVLVMLMCMELMLNGVNLALVTFAQQTATAAGAVLVLLAFVVATAEIAIAIPIVVLLVRRKDELDLDAFADLKG